MEAIDSDDVLDASIVFSETKVSNSENTFRLTSRFSTMASITISESDKSFSRERSTEPQHSPDGNGILFCFGVRRRSEAEPTERQNKKDTVDSGLES